METLYKVTIKDLVCYTSFAAFLIYTVIKLFIDNTSRYSEFDLYGADFRAYYTVGVMAKEGNLKDIYKFNEQEKLQQQIIKEQNPTIWFLNTPITAIMFIPLAYLSYETAYFLFAIINSLLILVSVLIITKGFEIDYKNTAILTLYFLIVSTIYHNQITALLLLIYASVVVLIRKNALYAGIVAGLLLIKPQHMLFLPLLAATIKSKQDLTKFLTGVICTSIVFLSVNIAIYGKNVFVDYLSFLTNRRTTLIQLEKYESFNIHSFAAVLDPKIGIPKTFRLIGGIQIILYFSALWLIYSKRHNISFVYLYSAAIIFSQVLNIHTKYIDLLILIIPLLLLTNKQIVEKKLAILDTGVIVFLIARQVVGAFGIENIFMIQTMILLIISFALLLKKADTHVLYNG